MKKEKNKNFTKLTQKKGISLIVLIVTIIVIIILAAVVILTISKNNPIENAKEARFKEDVRSFQDDLAMTVSKQYTDLQGQRDWKINTSDFKEMTEYIPSFTEKYKDKFIIWNDILVANKDLSSIEKKWAEDLGIYVIDYFIWDDDATTIIGINYEFLQGVTVLKIPRNCTAIRSDFVANNSNVEYRDFVAGITKVEIPDTVTTIGSYAFHNFKQLESINIPNSVTSIGENAFSWCVNLKSIMIPDSVTRIGNHAFDDCKNLENINTIPSSVVDMGSFVFQNTAITSINCSAGSKPSGWNSRWNWTPTITGNYIPVNWGYTGD